MRWEKRCIVLVSKRGPATIKKWPDGWHNYCPLKIAKLKSPLSYHGRVNEWMNEWMNEWTNGRMDDGMCQKNGPKINDENKLASSCTSIFIFSQGSYTSFKNIFWKQIFNFFLISSIYSICLVSSLWREKMRGVPLNSRHQSRVDWRRSYLPHDSGLSQGFHINFVTSTSTSIDVR